MAPAHNGVWVAMDNAVTNEDSQAGKISTGKSGGGVSRPNGIGGDQFGAGRITAPDWLLSG